MAQQSSQEEKKNNRKIITLQFVKPTRCNNNFENGCNNSIWKGVGQKKKLKKCVGCNLFYYCSKRCQKLHWNNIHRYCCVQIQNLD